MLTPDKIKQIQRQIKSGIPEGEIKNDLIKQGFSEDEIKEIFRPRPYDMKNWYLIFAVIFLLIGLYQVISNNGYILLVFSTGMFVAYINEVKRVGKNNL